MTEHQHAVWLRVADHSRRRRWYTPASSTESRTLAALFARGYFQRRRSDGAYRLFGLWPAPYRWPAWIAPVDRNAPHPWWPPYWPPCARKADLTWWLT